MEVKYIEMYSVVVCMLCSKKLHDLTFVVCHHLHQKEFVLYTFTTNSYTMQNFKTKMGRFVFKTEWLILRQILRL